MHCSDSVIGWRNALLGLSDRWKKLIDQPLCSVGETHWSDSVFSGRNSLIRLCVQWEKPIDQTLCSEEETHWSDSVFSGRNLLVSLGQDHYFGRQQIIVFNFCPGWGSNPRQQHRISDTVKSSRQASLHPGYWFVCDTWLNVRIHGPARYCDCASRRHVAKQF